MLSTVGTVSTVIERKDYLSKKKNFFYLLLSNSKKLNIFLKTIIIIIIIEFLRELITECKKKEER